MFRFLQQLITVIAGQDRWKRIRQLFLDAFSELPDEFPKQGLIHSNENGLKLGVWIMPDNQTNGIDLNFN